MLLKLAWRNLWRQKRRTLLTSMAIALALILSLLMRAFQEGQYANTIENSARMSTGLIQLQHPEFKQSQSIDDVIPSSEDFIAAARTISTISHTLPRIESYILAASGKRSKGVLIAGIDPARDTLYSGLADKVVAGSYLSDDDNAVLVGEGVASYFNLTVGDEIIFFGQGYRGQTAAGVYKIKGILHLPLKDLNNQLVYMPISAAQRLFSTGEQVTAWVMGLSSIDKLGMTLDQLKSDYGPDIVIRDWRDLAPDVEQSIVLDRAGGLVMMYLLFAIVGFSLFATLVMMTLERQREFAVMLATGMARTVLLRLVAIESLFIGTLGIITGMAIALPILVYYHFNPVRLTGEMAQTFLEMGYEPIMPVLINSELIAEQLIVVMAILGLCLIYPMWRVLRLNIIGGLKGGEHAA